GYNIGAFYSQGNLKSPYKGGERKRIWNSEPFIKPIMSLKKKIWYCCTSKGPLFPKDKKTVVLLSMNQLRKSVQMPITGNNTGILQQKNMPKLPLIKQQVKSEQKPDKAEIQAVKESRDTSSQKIEAYSQEIQAAKRHKQIPKSEWDSITRPS
ncbi:butyrophilin subfamily 3 member A1-like isoform X1, partial [Clarias magur]